MTIHNTVFEFFIKGSDTKKMQPQDLLILLDVLVSDMEDTLRTIRLVKVGSKAHLDLEIGFGSWSHDFNVILRARIAEADLFPDNLNQRILSKKLNFVYLYWNKCARYFQAINTDSPLLSTDLILATKQDMIDTKIQIDEYDYLTIEKEIEKCQKLSQLKANQKDPE